MYKSILVPYDNSDHAKHALKAAVELARQSEGGKVTVFHVADIPEFDDPMYEAAAQMAGVGKLGPEAALEMQRNFYAKQKEKLEKEAAPIAGDFANIVYRATSGKPHDAIAEQAETGEYDLIVMGCRGLGALRGALGSVSFSVLRSVDIPVLAVK